MCYAVVSLDFNPSLASVAQPPLFVLANACKGQVLRRVEQTAFNNACPAIRILSVNPHSMTFSRITGELLVSTTTTYRVRELTTITLPAQNPIFWVNGRNMTRPISMGKHGGLRDMRHKPLRDQGHKRWGISPPQAVTVQTSNTHFRWRRKNMIVSNKCVYPPLPHKTVQTHKLELKSFYVVADV